MSFKKKIEAKLVYSVISMATTKRKTAFSMAVARHLMREWSAGQKQDFFQRFSQRMKRFLSIAIVNFSKTDLS